MAEAQTEEWFNGWKTYAGALLVILAAISGRAYGAIGNTEFLAAVGFGLCFAGIRHKLGRL